MARRRSSDAWKSAPIGEVAVEFPFLPGGAILAMAVLGGAFALFTLLLRAVDRAGAEIRGSFLPGVVDGLRDWSRTRDPSGVRPSSPLS
jgi:hypothetical protein